MKGKIYFVLIALVIGFTACDDLALISYDVNLQTGKGNVSNVIVYATDVSDTTIIMNTPMISTTAALDSIGANPDLIKEAILKKSTITVESPENGDLNWLKNATLKIASPGLDTLLIGEVVEMAMDKDQLVIEHNDLDLLDYIKSSEVSFHVVCETDEPILWDHELSLDVKFKVKM